MMYMQDELEREEIYLDDQLTNGELTQSQYSSEMRELHSLYRAMEEEACQEAYDREADNW